MAVFLLLEACSGSPDSSVQDTIRVKTNEPFEIRLGASLGTGYRWMTADSAYLGLLQLDTSFVVQPKDIDGEPETQVFQFRGLTKGKTRLHFVYQRSWQKKDPPRKERTYTIIVE